MVHCQGCFDVDCLPELRVDEISKYIRYLVDLLLAHRPCEDMLEWETQYCAQWADYLNGKIRVIKEKMTAEQPLIKQAAEEMRAVYNNPRATEEYLRYTSLVCLEYERLQTSQLVDIYQTFLYIGRRRLPCSLAIGGDGLTIEMLNSIRHLIKHYDEVERRYILNHNVDILCITCELYKA